MEAVCLVCNNVRNNSKHGVSFQNLLTMLRREFREHGLDLKLKSDRRKDLAVEEFYVNAYYDAEDDQNNETPIEVIVHHNFDKQSVWDQKQTTDLLIQIFDATVHEYKHQRQSKKRKHIVYSNHDKSPYDAYLADPDEIDAYAISIAIELCRNLGKYRTLRYMSRFQALGKLRFNERYVSPQLAAYFGQFDNSKHPILRILAKKVYIRLMKVDTDHIFM
jgi:hypothetical protein